MRPFGGCLLALLLVSPLPALAATSPWDGTWKLDRSKSHFTGETFSFSRVAEGKLEYSNGADLKVLIPTDGSTAPGPYPGTSLTWKQTSPSRAEFTQMLNGKRIATQLLSLSPDGKTLTRQRTSFLPDGTTAVSTTIATRTAGSQGMEGTWKISEVKSSAPDVFAITSPAANTLHMTVPNFHESWQSTLDGTDAPFTGPEVIQGLTYALKQTGDHALDGVVKIDGKPVGYETDTLSADGKTWTIVSWDTGKESEKTSAVYIRQ